MRDFLMLDKAKLFAIALPGDISAQRFEVVEDGKLWRGYVGTVYDRMVSTERGHRFPTFGEARANAALFVEQCKAIAAI